jgi:large subunit ribosomal protein L24
MTAAKMKIRKGDTVVVLTGKDKGKQGEILRAMPSANRVVVKGINMVKKNVKPSAANAEGGITAKEMSIHASNVALVDPKSGKPTRVGFKTDAKGVKTRVAKKSGEKVGQ